MRVSFPSVYGNVSIVLQYLQSNAFLLIYLWKRTIGIGVVDILTGIQRVYSFLYTSKSFVDCIYRNRTKPISVFCDMLGAAAFVVNAESYLISFINVWGKNNYKL